MATLEYSVILVQETEEEPAGTFWDKFPPYRIWYAACPVTPDICRTITDNSVGSRPQLVAWTGATFTPYTSDLQKDKIANWIYKMLSRPQSKPFYKITPFYKIPRRIMQTSRYKSFSKVPSKLRKVMTETRDANPLWTYQHFNDKERRAFIARTMPQRVLTAYDALSQKYGPARADLFRYVYIYMNGGVYLDGKTELQKPLEEIITECEKRGQPFLSFWDRNFPMNKREVPYEQGELVQFFIAAPAGHPMMRDVLWTVVQNIEAQFALPESRRMRGKMGVLRTTGPIAFTKAVHAYYERKKKKPLIYKEIFSKMWWHGKKEHPEESKKWHYSKQTGALVVTTIDASMVHLPSFMKEKKESIYKILQTQQSGLLEEFEAFLN